MNLQTFFKNAGPKYRLVPVDEKHNSERTVVVFSPKAKGSTGAFEFKKEKRKGKFYDLYTPHTGGQTRISEEDRIRLNIPLKAGYVDYETGEDLDQLLSGASE